MIFTVGWKIQSDTNLAVMKVKLKINQNQLSLHFRVKRTGFICPRQLALYLNRANNTRESLCFYIWRAGERLTTRKKPSDVCGIFQKIPGFPVQADDVFVVLPVRLHHQVTIILPMPASIAFLSSRQHDLHASGPDQAQHT